MEHIPITFEKMTLTVFSSFFFEYIFKRNINYCIIILGFGFWTSQLQVVLNLFLFFNQLYSHLFFHLFLHIKKIYQFSCILNGVFVSFNEIFIIFCGFLWKEEHFVWMDLLSDITWRFGLSWFLLTILMYIISSFSGKPFNIFWNIFSSVA